MSFERQDCVRDSRLKTENCCKFFESCKFFERLSGTTGTRIYARLVSRDGADRTPGSTFAGGHRIRVTPVPIPNTEVKPDTADGTAWETVWESRSLPALFATARELRFAGFRLYTGPR